MKILIGVAHHAYSFIIQAKALQRGFMEIGADCKLIYLEDEILAKTCSEYSPACVITIGNWIDAPILLPKEVTSVYKVLPWIVCDDYLIDKYVDIYNNHGIVITTSLHCKENLTRSGLKKDRIVIIPEAVDPAIWYPQSKDETREFLKKFLTIADSGPKSDLKYNLLKAFDEEIPIIYTTGGDATKKGAQEVIKALSLLDNRLKWIYIIKTWPEVYILERSREELLLIKELGIYDRVRYFVGAFSDVFMRGVLNASSIYAAPSRSEGFGLPHAEAQMCGKPVITIGSTAAGETIIDKKTGFLVKSVFVENQPRADILDLSKKLDRLIRSKALREKMGKNAIKNARKQFSPALIAKSFISQLEKNRQNLFS